VSSGIANTIAVRFGQPIRRLREKHGLSQVEMAHRFGIDRGHVSDLERGKKSVCLALLARSALQGIRNQRFGVNEGSIVRKNALT
jgi:transcriptional regulator with XRE-family HTH domain